jgi:cell division protein FtsZ
MQNDSVPSDYYKPTTPENENPLIQMNVLLNDLEVAYEVVSYPMETIEETENLQNIQSDKTVDQEIEVNKEEDFVVSELGIEEPERNISDEPSLEMKVIDEDIPELNETEGSIEKEEALEHSLDFDLSSSFFDIEESRGEDGKADPIDAESEIEALTTEEESEFIFNEIEVKDHFEMEVIDPEHVAPESQIQMEFEIPLPRKNVTEQALVNHNELEDVKLEQGKTVKDFDEAALEIKFDIKELEETDKTEVLAQGSEDDPTYNIKEQAQQGPFDQSIDETLATQNEKRKEHLKAFNHKFMHQLQRVDDLEKQPAYKRQGLDLDTDLPDQPSRTTLDTDTNDDIQMRSNNSFLHDNVD